MDQPSLHIAMFPWFAFGHLNPFLNLSNKLAEKGHRISFFLPSKTQAKLEAFNSHPNLICFIPLVVPTVEGLPPGTETTSDVPVALHDLVMTAMDATQPDVEAALRHLKPDYVFFDFTHWLPPLAKELGIKPIHYCIITLSSISFLLIPASIKHGQGQGPLTEDELMQQPQGFPQSSIRLHRHEARTFTYVNYREYGKGVSFHERLTRGLKGADALSFRSCDEYEGHFVGYIEKHYGKPLLLSGPMLPTKPTGTLDEKWNKWLNGFEPGSVVFCAFGSECYMKKDQFQELVLGFELTGMPFFVALKPPGEAATMDEALPEGFKERVEGRGVVEGGWVQQQLIMAHPSVGCFVSHAGMSSVTEALVNHEQIVLIPNAGDQFINARLLSGDLKVAVEVERREDTGLFTKEDVCKAVKCVMEDNEVGNEVRANRFKLKETLLKEGLEDSYITGFIEKLRTI